MVWRLICPVVKVSLPRLTPCERVSSVRTSPSGAISATAMRMELVPTSMTAAVRMGPPPVGGGGADSAGEVDIGLFAGENLAGPGDRAENAGVVPQPGRRDLERAAKSGHHPPDGGFFDLGNVKLRHGLHQAAPQNDKVRGDHVDDAHQRDTNVMRR